MEFPLSADATMASLFCNLGDDLFYGVVLNACCYVFLFLVVLVVQGFQPLFLRYSISVCGRGLWPFLFLVLGWLTNFSFCCVGCTSGLFLVG
jgi:hypothetical protein